MMTMKKNEYFAKNEKKSTKLINHSFQLFINMNTHFAVVLKNISIFDYFFEIIAIFFKKFFEIKTIETIFINFDNK